MASNGNNAADLLAFFRSKKTLTDPEIAGIMGNLETESGFRTDAANPNEGAIGLAQWEGGRRTNLQRYASARHLQESDLAAQEGYLWEELTGPYSSVYSNLRSTQDPTVAARDWDVGPGGVNSGTGFENSAGTSQTERAQNAQSILSQIKSGSLKGGVAAPAGNTGTEAVALTGIPGLPGIPSLTGSVSGLVAPVKDIGKFFHALLWIFNINNFWKATLYITGTLAVVAGLFMVVYGAGKDRPAD